MRLANSKAEDLSIKRLTKNNPTMAAKFEELKENSIEWAHHIECMEKQPYDRKSCLDLITDAGYDILKEAEKMESYMCEE